MEKIKIWSLKIFLVIVVGALMDISHKQLGVPIIIKNAIGIPILMYIIFQYKNSKK